MAKEIERKFLVHKELLQLENLNGGIKIAQAYLSVRPESTVRIRIMGDSAYLTIKSRNIGAERDEWEYEIPINEAAEIMQRCDCQSKIEKTRYRYGRWEIDVFQGRQSGLVLAEIELTSSDEEFDCPEFIGREVTDDNRYYNSVLGSSNELPPII